ncbi:unnamed protein product [Moneuplotes crassus]|uniref:Uncharacterized protein n=1 Tax=Euplotes crassus TaxID=5936 RepID=A0AAD1Y980_EUPCR|nr:unnamed protein product [Moneuplotes crassus]
MSLSSLTAIELAEKVRSQPKPIEKKHLFHKMSESQVSTYKTPLSKSKQAFDQDNGLYILRESMYNKYYNKPGDSPKSTRLTTNRRVRPKNITRLQLSKPNLTEKGILSFFMNKV